MLQLVTDKPKKPKHTDWGAVKLDFLKEAMDTPTREMPGVMERVAAKHGVTFKTLRAMCSRLKWLPELEEIRDARTRESTQKLKTVEIFNETEVRVRQATAARLAIDKAIEAIRNIDPAKIRLREAIELLRLGITEERKALGLPELFSFVPPNQNQHGEYTPPLVHIQEQERLRRLGHRLLELVHTPTHDERP